jgi:hypothetical protein
MVLRAAEGRWVGRTGWSVALGGEENLSMTACTKSTVTQRQEPALTCAMQQHLSYDEVDGPAAMEPSCELNAG